MSLELVLTSLQELHQKVDRLHNDNEALLKQNNQLIVQNEKLQSTVRQLTKTRLEKRRESNHRGMSTKDAETDLCQRPQPTQTFFEWIQKALQGVSLATLFTNVSKRFHEEVFTLLKSHYTDFETPVFAVKREKITYIYDGHGPFNGFRVMTDQDISNVIKVFRCKARELLDILNIEKDSDDSDSDNTEKAAKIYFDQRSMEIYNTKIDFLDLTKTNLVHAALRKFNEYMLNVRGLSCEVK